MSGDAMRYRLRTGLRFILCAIAAVVLTATSASAQLTSCFAFVEKMEALKQLNTAEGKQVAAWIARFDEATDPLVSRGMLKLLINKDAKAVAEYFSKLQPHENPFTSVDDIYRAVGRFTDNSYEDVTTGFRSIIGNMVAETASNEKGALGALYVADKIVAGGGTVLEFERTLDLSGVVRRYDVIEAAGGPLGDIPGIMREVKNWTTNLSGLGDSRLSHFADEFRRDVLMHASTDFSRYRIDLRLAGGAVDEALVRTRLSQVFDAISDVDLPNKGAIKNQFLALFDSKVVLTLF